MPSSCLTCGVVLTPEGQCPNCNLQHTETNFRDSNPIQMGPEEYSGLDSSAFGQPWD